MLPTQHEAMSYFKKIVSLVDKQVIVYTDLGRTGLDLNIENIIDLLSYPRVIGVKKAEDFKEI
ncbi:dihydrodipicolinate synthase family protein [Liquorilactobacillus mali]|uniref:dihydrodipicolinate synthase family protein n=1 Tax=Liquorilactobacillus mali TaxID=1618 RepID=UPI00264F8568|nr:dihydrodipicolinate synthase family protein [Liquorilactobacillus mali]MDN7144944.1 dihydrodipicolinate synthase family protein [Liquorilactobacillus mali]